MSKTNPKTDIFYEQALTRMAWVLYDFYRQQQDPEAIHYLDELLVTWREQYKAYINANGNLQPDLSLELNEYAMLKADSLEAAAEQSKYSSKHYNIHIGVAQFEKFVADDLKAADYLMAAIDDEKPTKAHR